MDITVEEWNTEMGKEKDRKREREKEGKRGRKEEGRSEEGQRKVR